MSKLISYIFTVIGSVILVHAGYSANSLKQLLYESDKVLDLKSMPLDIIVELILSFLLIAIGQLTPLKFKEVVTSPDKVKASYVDSVSRQGYNR